MKKILIYIIGILICNVVYSQDTLITEKDTIITNTGKIEVEQVEVIKAFEAKLSDAKKISVSPTVKPVVPVEKAYNYDITIVPVDITYPDPIIKPLAMNSDAPKNVDNFYTRLGYGDLKSPYADASYQYVNGDEYDFIIDGHFYGVEDSEEVSNREFYESSLNLKGGYRIGENHKVNLDLGGIFDYRNLYDTTFTKIALSADDIERHIYDIDSRVNFHNIETNNLGLDYNVNLRGGFINMQDRLESSEVRFGSGINVQKSFSESFAIILDADASFYKIDFSSTDSTLQRMFTIKPGVRFNVGNFTLKALADVFIDNNGTNPFAEIEANVSILENSLQVFVGVDQKIENNSLATKYRSNPFVSPLATEIRNTISKQFYGGVRGKFRDFLSFNFSGGYEDITDQRFDRNNLGALMRQTFDDMTNIFINANVEFKINDKFTVGGVVNQNFFDPETLDTPINLSSYSYNAYSQITLINNKLKIRADLDLEDKIFWRVPITEELISGNTRLDLSIGADFYITKNIGLWARANNLLDREYLTYHYYPSIGRNLLGGIIVKF